MLSDRIRVCDGGLGSTLALHGHGVDSDPLWSARLLHTQPSAILKVHEEFVAAGADILVSGSYQASIEGFKEHLGLDTDHALQLMATSVHLARAAADAAGRPLLVAGSVGPYGACQGDGSEYTGAHLSSMSEEQLCSWHRPRVKALLQAGVDLLAVETLPAVKEALAIIRLLREFPGAKAWVTFSCKSDKQTNAEDDFSESVHRCFMASEAEGGVLVGVGVNCTPLHLVTPLLESLNQSTSLPPPLQLPRVVYPNSGEIWTSGKGWSGNPSINDGPGNEKLVKEWTGRGALVVGGCCRVTPADIAKISHTVKKLAA